MFYGEPKVHKVNIHHWAFWFNGLRTSSGNQRPNHLFWSLPLAADQCWSLWSAVTNGSEGYDSLAQLVELSKWQVYRKGAADSDRELYSLYSTYSPFWATYHSSLGQFVNHVMLIRMTLMNQLFLWRNSSLTNPCDVLN